MNTGTFNQQPSTPSTSATTPDSSGRGHYSKPGDWSKDQIFLLIAELQKQINAGATFGAGYTSSAWIEISKKFNDPHKHAESCRLMWLQLKERCRIFNSVLGTPGFTWDHNNSKIFPENNRLLARMCETNPELKQYGVSRIFPQFFNVFYIAMHATIGGSTVGRALCTISKQEDAAEPQGGARERDPESVRNLGATQESNPAGNDGFEDAPFEDSTFEEGASGGAGSGHGVFEVGSLGDGSLGDGGLGDGSLGDNGSGYSDFLEGNSVDYGFGHGSFGGTDFGGAYFGGA